ncbi:MAG: hypothetical protein P4L80_03800 [Xanthobacteraceae bacterium]|nr:hypothetical protein [Xanthobacteraceae bacterium]
MSLKRLIAGLATLLVVGAALPAAAQNPAPRPPGSRPRIEINPRPLLYRRCTSWYVIQYRPSGTVLFPEKHCWWVRG